MIIRSAISSILILLSLNFLYSQKGEPKDTCLQDPQYEALIALYNSTAGESWTYNDGWGQDCDYCNWFGVQCNTDGEIVQLFLPDNKLQGEIPNEIGGLRHLELLLLDQNDISGFLPKSFFRLTNLQFLLLNHNKLEGPLSNDIGNFKKLQWLLLNENEFSGYLPDSLGTLTNLLQVSLSQNRFSGSIPLSYSNLTQVFNLYLSNNLLEGCIPEELKALCGKSVHLQSNPCLSHDGDFRAFCLSDECSFERKSLMDLRCSSCETMEDYHTLMNFYEKLDGDNWKNNENWGQSCDYCEWYGVLCDSTDRVQYLALPDNGLKGKIPDEVGNLTNLEGLILDENELSSIPPNIGQLSNLKYFTAAQNAIRGEIPKSLSKCRSLSWIILSDNYIEGSIPEDLFVLPDMNQLILSGNKLSGSLPNLAGDLGNMSHIYLNDNQYEGCIPDSYFGLCGKDLRLEDNACLSHQGDFKAYCVDSTCMLPRVVGCGTCNDGIQNQDEEGIDCGGSCDQRCTDCPEVEDYLALMSLYNQTEGENWMENTNWGDTCDICQWYGIDCDSTGRVTSIFLPGNGLTGKIPSDIGDLTMLEVLILDQNNLEGEIPTHIGNLTNLQFLMLGENNLSGSIPDELGEMKNLSWLLLNNNDLTGRIPSSLGDLKSINQLLLSFNSLSGEIPPELGLLENVQNFYLNDNLLEGCIPITFKDYCGLDVNLKNNDCLSHDGNIGAFCNDQTCTASSSDNCGDCSDGVKNNGEQGVDCGGSCMPCSDCPDTPDYEPLMTLYDSLNGEEWFESDGWGTDCNVCDWFGVECDSTNRVTSVFLPFNGLKGSLPSSISELSNLKSILLDFNEIKGEIPESIGSLEHLELLVLSSNQLTGQIPVSLSKLENLQWLLLNQNELVGEIPIEVGELGMLTRLVLNNNGLSGTIPKEIANLDALEYLMLFSNDLSGCIPIELNIFCGVNVRLEDNPCLSHEGSFEEFCARPDCDSFALCDCTDPSIERTVLRDFYISLNGDDWTRNDGWVAECNHCDWYGVECNESGEVIEINLPDNNLSGELVEKISLLTELSFVNLSDNQIVGALPEGIGNLAKLRFLRLSNNSIRDTISSELYKLESLWDLRLDHNEISGEITEGIGTLGSLFNLHLQHNNLSGNIPEVLADLENINQLFLNDNALEGCIPENFTSLCGIRIDLSNNECLSHQGSMGLFCEDVTCDLSNTDCGPDTTQSSILDLPKTMNKSIFKKDQDINELTIYPNPVGEILNYEWKGDEIISVAIYDMNGQLKMHKTDPLDFSRIDVYGLSSGKYVLIVSTASNDYNSTFLKI